MGLRINGESEVLKRDGTTIIDFSAGVSTAAAAATTAGAAGEPISDTTGTGAADTGASPGGAGGDHDETTGAGGGTATGTGGRGGDHNVTTGAGGAASGAGTGGRGGDWNLSLGAGGSAAGGTAGRRGRAKIAGGRLHLANAQTIDMADAAVTLTCVPGAPAGTELVSNTLFVDANSSGTENLLLPPEADCNGFSLFIANAGGEDILVKDDSGVTTICTISANECAVVACNGTVWKGGILPQT